MNPQALTSIFGAMPRFELAELLNVRIERDRPTLFIRLATNETIKNKPKRWGEYDIVYIEMSFLGIRSLKINSFGTYNTIKKFKIEDGKEEASIELCCHNEVSINGFFDWARIETITPGLIGRP